MASVITSGISISTATNFIDAVSNRISYLWLALGKKNEESIDNTPHDTLKDEEEFRAGLLGVRYVKPTEMFFVIRKIQWTDSTIFSVRTNGNMRVVDSLNYYCVNTNKEVFLCTDVEESASENIEPQKTDTGAFDGGRYKWKYLYKANEGEPNFDFDNVADWIPIPYGDSPDKYSFPIQPSQRTFHTQDAYYTLGAHRILIRSLIDNEPGIGYDIAYNQIALISDLNQPSTESHNFERLVPSESSYNRTMINPNSGTMFFLRNSAIIQRQAGQSEEAHILMAF